MAFGFFRKQKNIADKIFYNAKIFTMDRTLPWAEAVAVKDGEIISVGSYEDMEDIIGSETEKIDLEGAYMLPGFIDIHRSPVMKTVKENYGEIADSESEIIPEVDEDYRFDPFNLSGMSLPNLQETIAADMGEPVEVDAPELEVDEEAYDANIKGTLSDLAGQGVTTVLNLKTPHEIEYEFEQRLIEFHTEEQLSLRFLGSLYLNVPVPGTAVKAMLGQRKGLCSELDDMIINEVLYIELDNASQREKISEKALEDIMIEVSDRGYIIFIEAFGYEELLIAYRAVDRVRNKGYKNNIIVASDYELKDADRAELSSDSSVYETWGTNIDAEGFFNGNVSDTEEALEYLTIVAAQMIGMGDRIGSIEKGKYADFAVFSEDPTEMSVAALSRQGALKTIVSGEIVFDAEDENNDYLLEMMMSQHN